MKRVAGRPGKPGFEVFESGPELVLCDRWG